MSLLYIPHCQHVYLGQRLLGNFRPRNWSNGWIWNTNWLGSTSWAPITLEPPSNVEMLAVPAALDPPQTCPIDVVVYCKLSNICLRESYQGRVEMVSWLNQGRDTWDWSRMVSKVGMDPCVKGRCCTECMLGEGVKSFKVWKVPRVSFVVMCEVVYCFQVSGDRWTSLCGCS